MVKSVFFHNRVVTSSHKRKKKIGLFFFFAAFSFVHVFLFVFLVYLLVTGDPHGSVLGLLLFH